MKKRLIIIFSIILVIVSVLFILFNVILYPKKYKNLVGFYSEKYDLDIALVYSIIRVESDFNEKAVSPSGAKGLMQIMPSTAKWIAKELGETYDENMLFDPNKNISFGCFYLQYLKQRFSDINAVICAYNAGETIVKNWLDENGNLIENKIAYTETKNYLKRVKGYYRVYSKNELGE